MNHDQLTVLVRVSQECSELTDTFSSELFTFASPSGLKNARNNGCTDTFVQDRDSRRCANSISDRGKQLASQARFMRCKGGKLLNTKG